MKKILLLLSVLVFSLYANSQTRDPNNKYLVWTNNILFSQEKVDTVKEEKPEEEKAKSFIEKYFRYESMCDWKEGMRFMVIPDKKDMVIRTFVDSVNGNLVSSMALRHKIMVYKGHSGEGALHERVNFVTEDDGHPYYFELPTASFMDYCYTKTGVPTLAYLGDVDTAIEQLVGKRLITKYPKYNVDISTTSYGYQKIDVPLGTEVTVVAAGVGTRNFPVKLIVSDDTGREFFQTVAISFTNSGMRDDEFQDEDNLKHTFEGSFELLGDAAEGEKKYQKFIGNNVVTLYETTMEKAGQNVAIPRMTAFTITAMHPVRSSETEKVKVVLEKDGEKFAKVVTFVRENVAGDIAGMKEDYYYSLFASGNTGNIKGVRKEHLPDIRRSIVRKGFNEAEVKLALGEPNNISKPKKNVYTWVYYSNTDGKRNVVFFDAKTKKVLNVNVAK